MRVLSFAAVGFHGREWWTRPASAALALATLSIPASAQPSAPFLDLAPDFASAIAAAVGPNAAASVAFAPEQQRLQVEVVRLLAARGVRVVENGEGARVSAECSTNLRERACAAEIRRGDDRRVVITTRARDRGQNADEAPIVAIELRPVYAQRRAMLDVAEAGDRLLVLTPESVSLVANDAAGSRSIASRPIETSRVWPRDVRGRLRVAGSGFEAFLPGVTCRGTVAPFALACADESESWPLGLANSGIAPSRNAFSTPDGFTFYEAAALGGGRWLAVGERGGGARGRRRPSGRISRQLRGRCAVRGRRRASARGNRRRAATVPRRGRASRRDAGVDAAARHADDAVERAGGRRGDGHRARHQRRTV